MAKKTAVKLPSRFLDNLNTYQVADYLKGNDVIFLPVGTVEMHGQMPLAVEHVMPLAVAQRLAEQADGLVLSGLVYFFPGSTAIGAGTIHVSPSVGQMYLREICQSLLAQGFRRQVLLTAHGPAAMTVGPFVREFFEETQCPIAYVDLCGPIAAVEAEMPGGADFDKMIWGGYKMLGRLDELQPKPQGRREPDPAETIKLRRNFAQFGYYLESVTQHGWWPKHELSSAERETRADEGIECIDRIVAKINPPELVENLRKLDGFIQKKVLPKHGKHLL